MSPWDEILEVWLVPNMEELLMSTTPLHQELHLLCQQALALLGLEPPIRGLLAGVEVEATHDLPVLPSSEAIRSAPAESRQRPAIERVSPPSVRRQQAGCSLGAQVLPAPHQLPGEPFPLEPMGNPPPEAWSDLHELLHKAKWETRQEPLPDHEARMIRDQWRARVCCADLVLVGVAGLMEPLHRRLVQAIGMHICPAVWVDALQFSSTQTAEELLLHPANRLLVLTPEACSAANWMASGYRQDPQGSTWKGRAAILLDSAEELEQDPARKRSLWDGLQAWKRSL